MKITSVNAIILIDTITCLNEVLHMSIRKKGRRKIVCEDKNYAWYVEEDYDSLYYLLRIVAENNSLIIV